MTKGKLVETSNKEVQTTIHCFPHVLQTDSDSVKVFSNRGCQTAVSTAPDTANIKFYAYLQFIPYQVIAEGCQKELDLPRRALLHWNLSNSVIKKNEGLFTGEESDNLTPQRGVLKKTNSNLAGFVIHHPHIMQKSLIEGEAQTTLTVSPHVLDTDEVANVFTELSIQTSITCLPNESISNILPQLKANLSHSAISMNAKSIVGSQGSRISQPKKDESINKVEEKEIDLSQIAEKDVEFIEPGLLDPAIQRPRDKSLASCNCGVRAINAIAGQLRVQASTLKLTSQVFPPDAKFEERMVEVLNTTIAVLQTEMAKMLEMYTDKNAISCSCAETTVSACTCDITSQEFYKPCRPDTCIRKLNKAVGEQEQHIESSAKENELITKDVPTDTDALYSVTSTEEPQIITSTEQPQIITSTELPYDSSIETKEEIEENIKNISTDKSPDEESPTTSGFVEEPVQDFNSAEVPLEIVGDSSEKTRSRNIPCECHPADAGAAPPTVASSLFTPVSEASEGANNPDSTTDVANASFVTNEELSMITDNVPSLAEDIPSPENTIKFEILLKKKIEDVESVSATSAIVVRATLSCPNTNKTSKQNTQTGCSLPDLREQVIRLSVIYKNGPETRIEETLVPGRPVTIAPPKSYSSHIEPPSCKSTFKSSGLACGKKSVGKCSQSNKAVNVVPKTADAISSTKSNCSKKLNFQPIPERDGITKKIINEFSDVSMACPIHKKRCGTCAQRAIGLRERPKTALDGYEITISVNVGGDGEKSESFMFEHETVYGEPYMAELEEFRDASAAVQTDLMLGNKLESESLNSIEIEPEFPSKCDSKTEMPWQKISLPRPGTYSIKAAPIESLKTRVSAEEEEEEQGVISLSSVEEDPSGESTRRKRKEPLLFESEFSKYNEQYMEGLYRAFTDSDTDENCGSDTEMPWKDILLPKNCKIRKTFKPKKCTCKTALEKISGTLISANMSRTVEEEDEGIIQIHIGFDEAPSGFFKVTHGAASQKTVQIPSVFSEMNQQPKRVPKQCILQVQLTKPSNASVSFQGTTSSRTVPTNSVMGCKSSRLTTTCKKSSNMFTPHPSTEINVIEPLVYLGNIPSHTKSCATVKSKMSTKSFRDTYSMPAISSEHSAKATISLKKLNEGNVLTLQAPNDPIIVTVKSSKASKMNSPSSRVGFLEPGAPDTKTFSSNYECPFVSIGSTKASKPDRVMAALEAYEAEMKPLMQAVTELQEKIKNLKITEMSDFGGASSCMFSSTSNFAHTKVAVKGEPGRATGATARVQQPMSSVRQYPPISCPFVQPPLYAPPPPMYGKIAHPMIPPSFPSYMPPSPSYMSSNIPDHQTCCRKPDREPTPHVDFSTQTKNYRESKRHKEEKRKKCCSNEKYKTRGYSSGNIASDYSDTDEKCSLAISSRRSSKNRHRRKHQDSSHKSTSKNDKSNKHDGCKACKDYYETYLRPGQAVKTSPDEFFSFSSHSNTRGCNVRETSSSKPKFEFNFPYR